MNVKDYVHQYYNEHQQSLLGHYPGLGIDRLLSEFVDFARVGTDEEAFPEVHGSFWSDLEEGRPLEYINHNSFFYRSNFYVNENVLIPRSETEILVEDSISFINQNYHSDFKIAEVGTGSFCIGLSIAIDIPKPLNLWGGDISLDAIEVSTINHFRLKNKMPTQTKVELVQSDRLHSLQEKVDLIVSNPPYIRRQTDNDGVHHQAHKFEPHLALYLDDKIFDSWFEEFFSDASAKLKEGGAFFMEGHEDSLLQLQKIAMKYFDKVDVKNDYTQRNRFLHAYK